MQAIQQIIIRVLTHSKCHEMQEQVVQVNDCSNTGYSKPKLLKFENLCFTLLNFRTSDLIRFYQRCLSEQI